MDRKEEVELIPEGAICASIQCRGLRFSESFQSPVINWRKLKYIHFNKWVFSSSLLWHFPCLSTLNQSEKWNFPWLEENHHLLFQHILHYGIGQHFDNPLSTIMLWRPCPILLFYFWLRYCNKITIQPPDFAANFI